MNTVLINTATVEQLTSLPGIGKGRSEKIAQNRPYDSLSALAEDLNLRESEVDRIADLVSFDTPDEATNDEALLSALELLDAEEELPAEPTEPEDPEPADEPELVRNVRVEFSEVEALRAKIDAMTDVDQVANAYRRQDYLEMDYQAYLAVTVRMYQLDPASVSGRRMGNLNRKAIAAFPTLADQVIWTVESLALAAKH